MNLNFRKAVYTDIPAIVRLLADDPVGAARERFEDPIPACYYAAFDAITVDGNNFLLVAELDNIIIGTLQLTFITHLVHQGGKRAQIEGVRIDKAARGHGLGKAMLTWAIQKAKEEGCHLVQLTMDKKRQETFKFYKSLGFIDSHEGFKMHLTI